jgi:hypothetical protein
MATPESELQDRIRRLEAVVAALLVSDRDVDPFLYDRLLERFPYPPRDEFYFLLREVARSRPYPGNRYREILAGLEERVGAVGESVARLQADSHTIFAIQSMGIDLDRVRIPRFLPVRVYVDRHDPEAVEGLSQAVDAMLRAFGLGIADDFPPQQGSWYKRWIAKFNKAATSEEAKELGRKVIRGAELAGLEKQQADINKTQAEALSNLMDRASAFSNAAIQCGTALVVVTSDGNGHKNMVGVTLTATQVIALENNQQLLYSPATLLAELKNVCDGMFGGEGEHNSGIVPRQ